MAQRFDSFEQPDTLLIGGTYNGWEHGYDTTGAEPTQSQTTHGGRVQGPYNTASGVDPYLSVISRPLTETADSGTFRVDYVPAGGVSAWIVLNRRVSSSIDKKLVIHDAGYNLVRKLNGWGNANISTLVATGPTYAVFSNPAGVTFDLTRLEVVMSAWSSGRRTLTIRSYVRRTSDYTWIARPRGDSGAVFTQYGTDPNIYVVDITDTDFQSPGCFAVGATRPGGEMPIARVEWDDGSSDASGSYSDRTTFGNEWMLGIGDWADVSGAKATNQYTATAQFRVNVPAPVDKLGILVSHLTSRLATITNAGNAPNFHLTFWKVGSDYDTTRIIRSVKSGCDVVHIPVSPGDQTWNVRLDYMTVPSSEAQGTNYLHENSQFSDPNAWLYIRGLRLYGSTRVRPHSRSIGGKQMRYCLVWGDSLTSSRQVDGGAAFTNNITMTETLWQSQFEIKDMLPAGWFPSSAKIGYGGYYNAPGRHLTGTYGVDRSDAPPHATPYTLTYNSVTRYTSRWLGKHFSPTIDRFSGTTWLQGDGFDIWHGMSELHVNDSPELGGGAPVATTAANAWPYIKQVLDATQIGVQPTTLGFKLYVSPPTYGHNLQSAIESEAAAAGYTATKVPTTPNAKNVSLGCYFQNGGWNANGSKIHIDASRHAAAWSWGRSAALADFPTLPAAPDMGSLSQSSLLIDPGSSATFTVTLARSTGADVGRSYVQAWSNDTSLATLTTDQLRLGSTGPYTATFTVNVPLGATLGGQTTVTVESGTYTGTVTINISGGDTQPPTVSAATILSGGTKLVVDFSEAIAGGTGFTLLVNGSPVALSNPAIAGSSITYDLPLGTTIWRTDTATLSYAPGNIVDLATPTANALASFSGRSVTNNSTQTNVTSVTVSPTSATLDEGETQQIVATVTGNGNPSTSVTWSVLGGYPYVSSGGLFTAPGQTRSSQTFTVRATSDQDPTQYADCTITIPAIAGGSGGGRGASKQKQRGRILP